jgi:hypothetical protein
MKNVKDMNRKNSVRKNKKKNPPLNKGKVLQCIADRLNSDLASFHHIDVHTRVACDTLADKIAKKVETTDPLLEDKAFALFSEMNCRGLDWVITPTSSWEEQVIESMCFKMQEVLAPLEQSESWLDFIASYGRFGPGASLNTEQVYALKRFDAPITYSHEALLAPYKRWCNDNGTALPERERQSIHGCIRETGASLSFVPKDTKIYRCVATEPSLDMFYQLGLHEYLRERLEELYQCDLSKQEQINRSLARLGSINGALCTIDSKSASDTVYLKALKHAGILPGWFCLVLRTVKSPLITYKDRVILLSMVGTQGCGFTFSLMTTIFYLLCVSVYEILGIEVNQRTLGIYGDDIVCDAKAYNTVISCMSRLGFIVNVDKSFSVGPFRESCGGDYYNGHNVRPVFIRKLSNVQHVCVIHNSLLVWGALHCVYLFETLYYLRRLAISLGAPRVPCDENPDAGIYDVRVRGSYRRFEVKVRKVVINDLHPAAFCKLAVVGHITQNVRAVRLIGDYHDGFVPLIRTEGTFSSSLRDKNPSYFLREVPGVDYSPTPLGWPAKAGASSFVKYALRSAIYGE